MGSSTFSPRAERFEKVSHLMGPGLQWQMSHALQTDVFQTGALPPTQADGFLPRRSSPRQLLTIPRTLGTGGPEEAAKKEFQACAIRVLEGLDIDAEFLFCRPNTCATSL